MGTVGSAADTDEVNEEKDFILPYFYSSLLVAARHRR
jgi:hypothetical protein